MITCITCRTPDEYADYIAYRYYKIVGSRVRTMTHNCNYDAVIDALKRKGFLHERSFKLRKPIDVFYAQDWDGMAGHKIIGGVRKTNSDDICLSRHAKHTKHSQKILGKTFFTETPQEIQTLERAIRKMALCSLCIRSAMNPYRWTP